MFDPRPQGYLKCMPNTSDLNKRLLDSIPNTPLLASRRKSVGKLSNPFDGANPSGKPKSRRLSKVGKLNSPFEQGIAEEGGQQRGFSRGSSRRSSISSRRDSLCESEISEEAENMNSVSSAFLLEMNSAMKGLADLAANAADDDQWGKSPNDSDEE